MSKDIRCGECREVLASAGDSNYEGLDPANSLCYPCATGGREQVSKETYLITFEITSNTNPKKWDWDNFLNLDEEESYYIHSIGQITKRGKE